MVGLFFLFTILNLIKGVDSFCNQAWCTSPNGAGGVDCWTVPSEEQTCSTGGSAFPTGEKSEIFGIPLEEYTCCLVWLIVIVVIIVILFVSLIFCCICNDGGGGKAKSKSYGASRVAVTNYP